MDLRHGQINEPLHDQPVSANDAQLADGDLPLGGQGCEGIPCLRRHGDDHPRGRLAKETCVCPVIWGLLEANDGPHVANGARLRQRHGQPSVRDVMGGTEESFLYRLAHEPLHPDLRLQIQARPTGDST